MIRIEEINNLNMPELQPFAHLNENQLKHYWEPYGGLFIGESPNVILRALDAGYVPVSLLVEQKYIEQYRRESADPDCSSDISDRNAGVSHHSGGPATNVAAGKADQDNHADAVCMEILRRLGASIPVYYSTLEVLSRITGYHLTRGVLCAFCRKPLPSVEEVCRSAHRIVILENIENPTNVGAIFRSAAALGMDAVLLTPESADPLYRRAVRVSLGTVFQIPWTFIGAPERHYTWMKTEKYRKAAGCGTRETAGERETGKAAAGSEKRETAAEKLISREEMPKGDNERDGDLLLPDDGIVGREEHVDQSCWPERGMQQLHDMGFRTAAMALRDDTISPDDPVLRQEEKLALILGNEGEGLLSETIEMCDYTIRIPMAHGVDSLNVAAASAVAFWELGKPRLFSGQAGPE